jgi:hypothetical protein
MEIKVCTTDKWNDKEWYTYLQSFNAVFEKNFDLNYFKHKYNTAIDGHSYHALLLNNDQSVVGACSVSPFKYKAGEEIIKIGQAVDVFILEEYRTDPLMLRRMYFQLKTLLIVNDIKAVLAVPNATAYPYWKNIVKWKDVGDLSYWMLPIKVGNIVKKSNLLNVFSMMLNYLWLGVNNVIVHIANNKEKISLYELVIDDDFCENRYSQEHIKVMTQDIIFYYRISDEHGVKTAYLIDARQNGRFTFKALFKGVNYIIRKTNADMVLYVGSMKLFQTLLIKVPKRFEPKRLPLTCDILNKKDLERYANMLEFRNWNFGLLNYDVR